MPFFIVFLERGPQTCGSLLGPHGGCLEPALPAHSPLFRLFSLQGPFCPALPDPSHQPHTGPSLEKIWNPWCDSTALVPVSLPPLPGLLSSSPCPSTCPCTLLPHGRRTHLVATFHRPFPLSATASWPSPFRRLLRLPGACLLASAAALASPPPNRSCSHFTASTVHLVSIDDQPHSCLHPRLRPGPHLYLRPHLHPHPLLCPRPHLCFCTGAVMHAYSFVHTCAHAHICVLIHTSARVHT